MVTIRAKVYRGAAGFHVREAGAFGSSIFCKTREGAELIRDVIKARQVDERAPMYLRGDWPHDGIICSVLLSGY